MEFIKLYNGTTESDIKNVNGYETYGYLSPEFLYDIIAKSIRLRDDEIIDGYIVNDEGIKVKISRKVGRKVKQK